MTTPSGPHATTSSRGTSIIVSRLGAQAGAVDRRGRMSPDRTPAGGFPSAGMPSPIVPFCPPAVDDCPTPPVAGAPSDVAVGPPPFTEPDPGPAFPRPSAGPLF